jgi:hypothetical protein
MCTDDGTHRYDMLGGMVGQIGDGSHVNSYVEPLFHQHMDAVVEWVRLLACAPQHMI